MSAGDIQETPFVTAKGIEVDLASAQSDVLAKDTILPLASKLDASPKLDAIRAGVRPVISQLNRAEILPVSPNAIDADTLPDNSKLDAMTPNVPPVFLPPPPPLPLERASSVRCPRAFYDEIRFLASGAHGSAFLVKRFQDSRFFVAKKVDVSGMDAMRRQTCLDEIGLLRRIRHDCIAEYVDFLWTSEERNDFWLVLKHYPGGDLQQRINDCRASGGQLDRVRVQVWMAQLCLALEHVHALRIVHNDVKGSNLFITGANNVVLGDFGISEELEQGSPSSTCHAGSPAFMAPERWNGACGSFATDMWSAGIVAYELIALRRPFVAHNLAALVYKLSSEQPEPLAEDLCSADLWELIAQLLNKQPDARPSAEEALQFPYLRYCVEDLLRWSLFEDTAENLSQTRQTLADAERHVRRALGQGSSSSESEAEDPIPVDEVLTLRSRNSWDDPTSQRRPAAFPDTDSWHKAEVIEETLLDCG
eukprot:TRINITY_DN24573_c0_g1_i1.p1 TRINITY_DN24573_c0_g1~~TRINITY_DN24573_c0_g1_i1.p1  ORF type:complete len:485 (+),score=58.33 TRINITY_DN24573_c0_g1_i1:23-1456(+)